MGQEEFIDNNLEEKEIEAEKTEKTKKVLLILLILLLFAGTYYYYGSSNRQFKCYQQDIATNDTNSQTIINLQANKEESITKQPVANEKEVNKTVNKINFTKTIKPSDKTRLAKLAMTTAGKSDPFSGTGVVNSQYKFNNSKTGILPPPPKPSYINGLPTIGDLPKFDFNRNPYSMPEFKESLAVKGFVGDKVIVNVNGSTESLKVNETFQGVKVLKIDTKSLIAKFKKDGEIITKSIKNLTDIEDRSDIKMLKDLNK